jgi:tRNA-guanine family transglycosylase
LRHLHQSGEILAARALTEHNLYFYARLMREAQAAIASGTYRTFAAYVTNMIDDGERAEMETK